MSPNDAFRVTGSSPVFGDLVLKVFYIQVWCKCEIPPLFFLIKDMAYRKKLYIENIRFFSVDYVKTNGSHDCTHMTSHTIWVDEITGVIISTKKVNKNWNFCNAPPLPPPLFCLLKTPSISPPIYNWGIQTMI